MRGNPYQAWFAPYPLRSIPAYAGEPLPAGPDGGLLGVYPRVCGGTATGVSIQPYGTGLSPRMRGNPVALYPAQVLSRSIPAYAGEPAAGVPKAVWGEVYPRVCGGTHQPNAVIGQGQGLSPRMRGNHAQAILAAFVSGSIPAYAGEPKSMVSSPAVSPVYPRVCGGTAANGWTPTAA